MDTRKSLGVAAAVMLLAAIWLVAPWKRSGSPVTKSLPTTAKTAPVSVSSFVHSRRVAAAVGAGSNAPAVTVSYKQEFMNATDYFEFAHSILAAAHAGNSDAQYYLWAVRFSCDHDAVAKFGTLDEAEQYGARLSISMEEVHKSYGRCHKLRTRDVSDLGDQWDWLNRAIKGGQPNAEATGAQFRIAQERAGANPGGGQWLPQAAIGEGADPHQMALKALQSGDPSAWLQIGQFTNYLNPRESHQESFINRLAWTVLACQRMGGCPDCGPRCDTTNLMSQAGNNWAAVQQRAQEIADKLDAGQWDQLGLGFSAFEASGRVGSGP